MAALFDRYPQLEALKDRGLFLSGKLMGAYGILWNDACDLETETVYEDGITVREEHPATNQTAASAVQSDISKIERGIANPSVSTLEKIAKALGGRLSISIAIPAEK